MQAYMLVQFLKYILEGLAVAIAAYLISANGKSAMKGVEILGLGMTAAATFAILDVFAPSVATSARQGSGFGLGAQQVGWPMGEGFAAPVSKAKKRAWRKRRDARKAKKEGFNPDMDEELEEGVMPEYTEGFGEEDYEEESEVVMEGFRPDEEDYTEGFANDDEEQEEEEDEGFRGYEAASY